MRALRNIPTIDDIQSQRNYRTPHAMNMAVKELCGHSIQELVMIQSRKDEFVHARKLLMLYWYFYEGLSLQAIARRFKRDQVKHHDVRYHILDFIAKIRITKDPVMMRVAVLLKEHSPDFTMIELVNLIEGGKINGSNYKRYRGYGIR